MPRSKITPPVIQKPENESIVRLPLKTKYYVLLLLAFILVLFAWKNKPLFIAAIVNGKPISTFRVNQRLQQVDAGQTVDSLITEILFRDEIKKRNIVISEQELNSRIDQIRKTVPQNSSLEKELELRNTNLEEVKGQLRLQLGAEKLAGKDISLTDTDIDSFIKQNEKLMTATTTAEKRNQADQYLRSQKITENLTKLITDLRSKAKITRFLGR